MNSIKKLVAMAALVGCFISQGSAQTSSATISGHVVDQSGGVIPNAEVSLINQETNVTVATHTNANGDFTFPDQQSGTFTVVVHGAGYKELRQVNLALSASQNLSTGTLVLRVGAVTETVTVTAAITPLQTTSSERSGVLDNKQVENLFTLGRDVMGLLQTLPGVYGGGGSSTLGTTGTPTVNGVLNEYNLVTVDGVTANTRGLNTMDDEINEDAVQQVSLLGSNYQAAYGKTAGANITYVTKERYRQVSRVLTTTSATKTSTPTTSSTSTTTSPLFLVAVTASTLPEADQRPCLLAWAFQSEQGQAFLLLLV